jgi:hypothetical protein
VSDVLVDKNQLMMYSGPARLINTVTGKLKLL